MIFTYPAIFHLTDMVIGDGGDNYEYLSYQYLAAQNLSQGETPLAYTDTFRYPVGFNFGAGSDARLFVLLGGILNPILGGILTHNFLLLLILSLNGFCAYLFFKELSKSNLLGLFGGLTYGYSYYVLALGGGWINLLQAYCFPLSGLLFLLIFKKKQATFINILLFFCSLLLVALCSLQYFLISLVFIIFFIPISLLFFRHNIIKKIRFNKSIITKTVISFLIFICLFILIFKHNLIFLLSSYQRQQYESKNMRETVPFVPFFVPNKYNSTYLAIFFKQYLGYLWLPYYEGYSNNISFSIFFGYIEMILFFFFLLKKKKKEEWFFLSLFLTFFILSLGVGKAGSKIKLPYYYLAKWYPFKGIYETERFFVLHYFFLVTGIIFLLGDVIKKRWGKMLLYFLLIGIILERVSPNYYLSPTLKADYQEIVSEMGGKAVLDLPIIIGPGKAYESKYNLLPFYYKKKITGGYFHWLADTEVEKTLIKRIDAFFIYDEFSIEKDRTILLYLKEKDISTIVIHKDIIYDDQLFYKARLRLLELFPDLTKEEMKIKENDYEFIKKTKNNFDYGTVKLERVYSDDRVIIYKLL